MDLNQYRKSPRANWINYDNGIFFITVCTKDKQHFFGTILRNEMHLSQIGKIADHYIQNANKFNKEIEIPLYVIMPNHIHMIVSCNTDQENINIVPHQRNPNPNMRTNGQMKRHVPTLSKYINSFKGSVTKQAKKINKNFQWQYRFYDHRIRNSNDGNNIATYIESNILNWEKDCFYT